MHRFKRELYNALLILTGVSVAAVGLKGFLYSSKFIDGGVTGISMLLAKTTSTPLAVWLPIINLPFIALAFRHMGLGFAIRSLFAICGLALALAFVPCPDVTPDLLLKAVFGGFFIGAGIGFAMRGNAVLDGTEIAALLLSKKVHLLKVGDVVFGFNIILFVVAASTLGADAALYSILTYIAAARTLNFVLYGLQGYSAVTIISSESLAIRKEITNFLGRGVTVLRGYGGLRGEDTEVLYCVVTKLEVGKVRDIVSLRDSRAFVTIHALSSAEGGMTKRLRLHS